MSPCSFYPWASALPLKSHRTSVISLQSNPQIFENGCHFPRSFLSSVDKHLFLSFFLFLCVFTFYYPRSIRACRTFRNTQKSLKKEVKIYHNLTPRNDHCNFLLSSNQSLFFFFLYMLHLFFFLTKTGSSSKLYCTGFFFSLFNVLTFSQSSTKPILI